MKNAPLLAVFEEFWKRHKLASVGRNAKRQDRNGLGPKDEHAVPRADEADAQGDTGSTPSPTGEL